mmetsp:Transcript_10541/g.64693  ORF Transcript_10541/g.64693 Transcript_10541/m.64693 type:complete len:255 (+) Transcript_10541:143-907(+)
MGPRHLGREGRTASLAGASRRKEEIRWNERKGQVRVGRHPRRRRGGCQGRGRVQPWMETTQHHQVPWCGGKLRSAPLATVVRSTRRRKPTGVERSFTHVVRSRIGRRNEPCDGVGTHANVPAHERRRPGNVRTHGRRRHDVGARSVGPHGRTWFAVRPPLGSRRLVSHRRVSFSTTIRRSMRGKHPEGLVDRGRASRDALVAVRRLVARLRIVLVHVRRRHVHQDGSHLSTVLGRAIGTAGPHVVRHGSADGTT